MGIIQTIEKQKRNYQQKLINKALRDAKHIARILVKQFGAKEIILYGSLAKAKYFDTFSDIDLVAKGLGANYLKAYGYCLQLTKFNLDLKAYEDIPLTFRKKIEKEGIFINATR